MSLSDTPQKPNEDHVEVSSKKANPALKVTNLQVSRSPFPRKKNVKDPQSVIIQPSSEL